MTNDELLALHHCGNEFESEIERRIKEDVSDYSDYELADNLVWCNEHYCYFDPTTEYMTALVSEAAKRLRNHCR